MPRTQCSPPCREPKHSWLSTLEKRPQERGLAFLWFLCPGTVFSLVCHLAGTLASLWRPADHVHLHCVRTTCFCCWAFGEVVASCCRGQGAGREGVRIDLCCQLCFKQWGLLLLPPASSSSSTAGCIFAAKQRWGNEYVCATCFCVGQGEKGDI